MLSDPSPAGAASTRASDKRIRVLFFAEAVTLAHLARISVLSAALDPHRYEAVIACRESLHPLLPQGIRRLPLDTIPSEQFVQALSRGAPVYSLATLRRYADEDRRLMEAEQPRLVVGDFRLSLSVSARQLNVTYAAVCNAYWSPFAVRARFPLPELPMTHLLPLALARAAFFAALPISMSWHARHLNRLRQEFGMPVIRGGLRGVYTDADQVLYADAPELHPTFGMPATHQYIGHILWEPPAPHPEWWDRVPQYLPLVYVTMGSSGQLNALELVLEALADLPVVVVAATATTHPLSKIPSNAFVDRYLPGTELARRASVVICNGGSLTCHQALAAGVPVLGIASNMDQFMNMEALQDRQAGLLLRADRLSASAVRDAVQRLLTEAPLREGAARASRSLSALDASERFREFVDTMLT